MSNTAKRIAANLPPGKHRVNIGRQPRMAEKLFAEQLLIRLQQAGVELDIDSLINGLKFAHRPRTAAAMYHHRSSKSLQQVLQPMLKYSTNFVANQIVIALAAEHFKKPATAAATQQYLQQRSTDFLGWQGHVLLDGAGLSARNKLSPAQLVSLLQAFKPWRGLLPEISPGIMAKSGTLRSASTLAGYYFAHGQWREFAVMFPKRMLHRRRNHITAQLLQKAQ